MQVGFKSISWDMLSWEMHPQNPVFVSPNASAKIRYPNQYISPQDTFIVNGKMQMGTCGERVIWTIWDACLRYLA